MNNFEKQDNNLQLWKLVEVTNPKWLKEATVSGNKIKAINPQKQLKQATEIFGPYGMNWGLKDCKRQLIDFDNTVKLLMLECIFFYPGGEFPMCNTIKICYTSKSGKYIVDDEAPKKLDTNTRSKALSLLGFGSDVFEGNHDQQGYSKIVQFGLELTEAEIVGAKKAIKEQTNLTDLARVWGSRKKWHDNKELAELHSETLKELQELKQ